jgi:hypothetical protein
MDEPFIMGVTARYACLYNIINTTDTQQQTWQLKKSFQQSKCVLLGPSK